MAKITIPDDFLGQIGLSNLKSGNWFAIIRMVINSGREVI